jgi:hypothetical protein
LFENFQGHDISDSFTWSKKRLGFFQPAIQWIDVDSTPELKRLWRGAIYCIPNIADAKE